MPRDWEATAQNNPISLACLFSPSYHGNEEGRLFSIKRLSFFANRKIRTPYFETE